ncbi:MAG: acyltransferase [Clostridia bacterium]|nr:acyltransferase [Clostridia bacterium]
MENLVFIVSALLILIILISRMTVAPKKQFHSDYFSVEVSKGIQGLLGICAILHLTSVALEKLGRAHSLFHVYFYCGILIVGYFFFCSGYGLIHSLNTKENYLQGFVKKRIILILVPFFICNYIYLIFSQIMGVTFSSVDLIAAFFGLLLSNNEMWFAVEIMILYLLFYLIFRLIKKQNVAIGVMSVCVIALMALSFIMGRDYDTVSQGLWFRGEWWYNTTALFLFGMIYAKCEERLVKWLHISYVPMLIFAIIGFVMFFMIDQAVLMFAPYEATAENPMYVGRMFALFIQIILVAFFILLMLLIMMKVRFQNKLLSFLGEFSLEILLINYFNATLFFRLLYSDLLMYLIVVIATSIVEAVIINKIKKCVLNIEQKKGKSRNV